MMNTRIEQIQTAASRGWVRILGITTLCLVACGAYGQAVPPVTMGWDLSTDTNVTGYEVYYGTTSGDYSNGIDAGTNVATQIAGLNTGTTYYFVVVAYNAAGTQSVPSSEVTYTTPNTPTTLPVTLSITMGATPTMPVTLSFPAATGHWYGLQASADMVTWATIWQTTTQTVSSVVQHQDGPGPSGGAYASRYYRLACH